jgi:hypothetical protein
MNKWAELQKLSQRWAEYAETWDALIKEREPCPVCNGSGCCWCDGRGLRQDYEKAKADLMQKEWETREG